MAHQGTQGYEFPDDTQATIANDKPQVSKALTWGLVAPPIGIEPMTYSIGTHPIPL
jgi:hypothetical protein